MSTTQDLEMLLVDSVGILIQLLTMLGIYWCLVLLLMSTTQDL